MRANMKEGMAFTLAHEKGDVNDPADAGGATRDGITQATYDRYRNFIWKLPDRSVFLMTPSERDTIYEDLWHKVADDKPSGYDLCVFDAFFHSGMVALDWSSKCYNGDLPSSITTFCNTRLEFLRRLKGWPRFGHGWQTRVEDCERVALTWSGRDDKTAAPKWLADLRARAAFFMGKRPN